MMIALEDAFRMIKNKFSYPNGYMTSLTKVQPAKYLHKCDRKSDCECVPLVSYLLHGLTTNQLMSC